MELERISKSISVAWAVGISVLLGLTACSSDEKDQDLPYQHTGGEAEGMPIESTGGTTAAGGGGGALLPTGGTIADSSVATGGNLAGTGGDTAGRSSDTAGTDGNPGGTDGNLAGSDGNLAGTGDAGGTEAVVIPPGPLNLEEAGPYPVIVEKNVGTGFEAPIASGDQGDGVAGCLSFASGFGGDEYADQTEEFVRIPDDLDMALYSMYRPEALEEGKKYSLITWGNGTCALPSGYGTLLEHFASYGFLVVAGHSRWVGTTGVMTRALDWAFAANDDPASPYYQKIDTEKVGAAGHSQGSMATTAASRDARVKAVILYNGGTSASKPFFAVSGDEDLFGSIGSYQSAVARTPQSAYIWYHDISTEGSFAGHLTLMIHPERVVGPSVAWFLMMLENDVEAREYFLSLEGGGCTACGNYEAGQNGL